MTDEIETGHLPRRKIEARVLIPFIAACREKFGPRREAITATVQVLAVEEGTKGAGSFGNDVAGHCARAGGSCRDVRFRRKT